MTWTWECPLCDYETSGRIDLVLSRYIQHTVLDHGEEVAAEAEQVAEVDDG